MRCDVERQQQTQRALRELAGNCVRTGIALRVGVGRRGQPGPLPFSQALEFAAAGLEIEALGHERGEEARLVVLMRESDHLGCDAGDVGFLEFGHGAYASVLAPDVEPGTDGATAHERGRDGQHAAVDLEHAAVWVHGDHREDLVVEARVPADCGQGFRVEARVPADCG